MASKKMDQVFEMALPALVFGLMLSVMLACTEDKRSKDVNAAAPAAPAAPVAPAPASASAPVGPVGAGGPIIDAWWDGNQLPNLGCDNATCNPNIGQLIVHGRRGPRGCTAVLIAPQVAATSTRCLNEFDFANRDGMHHRCAVQFAGEFVTCRRIVNGRARVQGTNPDLALLALDRPPQAQSYIQIASGNELFDTLQRGGVFLVSGISRANGVRTLVTRECSGIPSNVTRQGRQQHFETMDFQNCPIDRTFLGGSVTTPSGHLVGIITSIADRRTLDQRRGFGFFSMTRIFPPRFERPDRAGGRFTLEWKDWQIDFSLD